jgi:hypothetical protein
MLGHASLVFQTQQLSSRLEGTNGSARALAPGHSGACADILSKAVEDQLACRKMQPSVFGADIRFELENGRLCFAFNLQIRCLPQRFELDLIWEMVVDWDKAAKVRDVEYGSTAFLGSGYLAEYGRHTKWLLREFYQPCLTDNN